MANVLVDENSLSGIANAIRSKNGSSNTYKPAQMPAAIEAITTGTDTSDATAAAGDILSGKTAYVQGSKVTGTISSKAAATINTSTSNQTISAGQYLSGTQTIRAVTTSGIEAANIKKGVTVKVGDAGSAGRIKNVTGTLVAGVPITLTVSVTTGAIVTATKGTATVSGTSANNSCSLTLPSAGTWTVTATLNGQTDTGAVTVQDNYSLSLTAATASTTPKSGVTYTNGLRGITQAKLVKYAEAISNNSAITKTANAVYIDDGSTHVKLSVGDTVSISVDSTDYDFRILGFNHDDLASATYYGSTTATGKAGITFQMVDTLSTTYEMNSTTTNVGGWDSTLMFGTHLPAILATIDSEWASIIAPVTKQTSIGNKKTTIETSTNSLFLLAECEIFSVCTNSVAGEGNRYAYWAANDTDAARIKYKAGTTTTRHWWGRSPYKSDAARFSFVNTSGKTYYNTNATEKHGVSFAFCV